MNQRKELLITLEFPPAVGGIATYLSELFRGFPHGSLKVLAPPGADIGYPHFVSRKEMYFRRFWPRWSRTFFHVWEICSKEAISRIYISHVLPMGYVALMIYALRRIPYVVFVHGMDIRLASRNKWKRFWLKTILTRAQAVAANSVFTKGELSLAIAPMKLRIEVIEPPPKIFGNLIRQTSGREQIVLTVARLVPRKGLDLGIAAFANIRRSAQGARYIIVGDGPERARLSSQIKSLGLEDCVHLLGSVPDATLAELYSRASVFLFPVRELVGDVEGFGIAPLEANAHGIPVVASRSGGVAEAIKDGVTGILVPPGNVQALEEATLFLLKNPEVARSLGAAGMEWARRFMPAEQTKKLLNFLAMRQSFSK